MAQPQLIVNKRQGRNQCYDEALGDRVLPLRMMQIPAGTFLMGSPEDELERREREGPQHEVTLSQFFMGKYPVTQIQWRVVAALPLVERELKPDPSNFKGDLRPVESVSWYDAVEFCTRLTLYTKRQYRLPTEAEWEYACRAGTTTPFHFGETITTQLANYMSRDQKIGEVEYSGSYGKGPKGDYREETTPIGHFEGTNAFGLCDMHGNVCEWCQDHWHSDYGGALTDGSAWLSVNENAKHVLRGGAWNFNPKDCRSAYRYYYEPDGVSSNVGFRICCSAEAT